jgi:23S rRNA maturation-related 3'-5' exoribonuclease YhaM
MTLKKGTQADHIRGVTRLAIAIADDFTANFPGIPIKRDIVVAGALCHDVGKPQCCSLYDPNGGGEVDAGGRLWGARP